MYTYEVRVLPVPVHSFHVKRPGDFTVKTRHPLDLDDTVESRGVAYEVRYLADVDGVSFALVTRMKRHAAARSKKNIEGDLLMRDLRAACARVPREQRPLFERQLKRLLDLYTPSVG